ncbi:probable ATP-dependent DNA helicase RecS [Mercenaria mercenaria]|uniref:probable ATP-dependent DNA helicase RecS n=1 Tax=Mercenaria mercenaria TaxID=6596 RepID=UPI00234F1BF1|nr:probable ATP-dependent DNA helicase RecS [Mercenaria mercenaria]
MASSSAIDYEMICAKFNIDELKEFQKDTISNLVKGRDVFLSVKTGGGKSLCYQTFGVIWRQLHDENCQVLVVTPLISIMKEQCQYLSSLGFTATYIGKDEDVICLEERFDFLFSSPENILGVSAYRGMLSRNESIKLLVVDEAHTVLHWGESDAGEAPFRAWYGKLGEARSLISCPLLLITAKNIKQSCNIKSPKRQLC